MTRIARHGFAFIAALPLTAAAFSEILAVPRAQSRPAFVPALV